MNIPGGKKPNFFIQLLNGIIDFIYNSFLHKRNRWKMFTVFFCLTLIFFSIIATQYVESRQHIQTAASIDSTKIYYPSFNRYEKEIIIQKGETLASILNNIGVPGSSATEIIDSLAPHFNLKKLQPGKKIKMIIYQEAQQESPVVELIKIETSPVKEIRVSYRDGAYHTNFVDVKTMPVQIAREGVIVNSLYSDAYKAGIPETAIMDLFHLFSFDVDFQRDIYSGNKFKILFENLINLDGEVVSKGNIIFAELQTAWKTLKVYRFIDDKGRTDYYDEQGVNIRKTLLKTPIHGARISSGYGSRSHPIEGYNHVHRALDFAAPKGTPIIAAGSGTVELAGWNGGYGNCIIIRHANEYKTLYAHMSAYAGGMRRGKYINQGDIIGYVGTTGVSTGNHLHYEVIFRGNKINPSTLKTPPEKKLSKSELEKFLKEVSIIDTQYLEVLNI